MAWDIKAHGVPLWDQDETSAKEATGHRPPLPVGAEH